MPVLMAKSISSTILSACILPSVPGRHREILAERRDQLPIDVAGAGHHTVGGQFPAIEFQGTGVVPRMHADFLERVFLEQQRQTVARRKQSLGATLLQLFLTAATHDAKPALT